MAWKVSVEEHTGFPVWIRQIEGVDLIVSRSSDTARQWQWSVRHGIVTVTGYSRTIRGAKMRATRVGRQYAIQGVLWGL